jgi:hypothetical protein
LGGEAKGGSSVRVVNVNTWKILPGRLPEALGLAETARKIHERLGAQADVLVPLAGGDPSTMIYVLRHDDIEAYGKFTNALLNDGEWNTLMKAIEGAIQQNPGTELVSNTLLTDPWIPK